MNPANFRIGQVRRRKKMCKMFLVVWSMDRCFSTPPIICYVLGVVLLGKTDFILVQHSPVSCIWQSILTRERSKTRAFA